MSADVSRVDPGVFGETANKERVFFVESASGDSSTVQNVFVSSMHQSKTGVSMSRYAARIETNETAEPQQTPKNLPTWTLLTNRNNANLGELAWRLGVTISALVLVLLAIPMSFVNPRAGRSVNLLFALLTYIVYSNLLSVIQARIAQGKLDFAFGWWVVHAGMILLLVFMFAQRMQLIRLRLAR